MNAGKKETSRYTGNRNQDDSSDAKCYTQSLITVPDSPNTKAKKYYGPINGRSRRSLRDSKLTLRSGAPKQTKDCTSKILAYLIKHTALNYHVLPRTFNKGLHLELVMSEPN